MSDSRINQLITGDIDRTKVFPFQIATGDVDPINNTIQALKDDFIPYKSFSAWYALSGLVITTFQNDFTGTTFTFTNPSNGVLNIVPSNPIFDTDKTIVISGTLNASSNQYFVNGRGLDVDIAIITLTKYDNSLSSTPNFSELFIEIRVYN